MKFTHTNKSIRLGTGLLTAFALASTLTACGGGDDPTTVPPTSTPAVTAPTTNPSTGVELTGNLNYLVTASDLTTRTSNATVTYSAPNGTLTLDAGTNDALTITTTDSWANVTWPNGLSGRLAANGNAGFVCSTAGAQVGLSHNMLLVANPVDIVKGKTFTFHTCDAGTVESEDVVFKADGSTNTATLDIVTKAFSNAGVTDNDGETVKLRLYAYTANGNTTYAILDTGSSTTGTSVALGEQK